MTEMKIIPGKHRCGRELDMRKTDVKDDKGEIVSWIIYGFCKKCKVVLISDLILKPEEPILDRDFMIDYTKISEETDEKNIQV